jgi:hypothetical protein
MKRTIHLACLMLSCIFALHSASQEKQPSVPSGILRRAGCYQLSLSSWQPALRPAGSKAFNPPDRIRLSTTRHSLWCASNETCYAVFPMEASATGSSIYNNGAWATEGKDGIVIRWSSGFQGIILHLRDKEGRLSGTAAIFSDVAGVKYPTCNALAVPIACENSKQMPQKGGRQLTRHGSGLVHGGASRKGHLGEVR